MTTPPPSSPQTARQWNLDTLTAEIENHVASDGWDQAPRLFALVGTRELVTTDSGAASSLGLDADSIDDEQALTPVEQDELPAGDVDELLAQIGWPDAVRGCGVTQEIVFLPPQAQDDLDAATAQGSAVAAVAAHPLRREARLVVCVLRDGTASTMLRLRAIEDESDTQQNDLLTGPDLAPNLVLALLATFQD